MPLTIGPTTAEFIALSEVKAHANVTSTSDDAELRLFAEAAQEAVEGLVGPVLHRAVTETVQAVSGVVVLRYAPVVSVTSLTSGGAAVEHTASLESGVISLRPSAWGAYRGDLDVTYVAGRTVVPTSLRVAALIIAEHLYRTQKGSSPIPPGYGDDSVAPAGMGYGIPNRAMDLLRPYLLPPSVA